MIEIRQISNQSFYYCLKNCRTFFDIILIFKFQAYFRRFRWHHWRDWWRRIWYHGLWWVLSNDDDLNALCQRIMWWSLLYSAAVCIISLYVYQPSIQPTNKPFQWWWFMIQPQASLKEKVDDRFFLRPISFTIPIHVYIQFWHDQNHLINCYFEYYHQFHYSWS